MTEPRDLAFERLLEFVRDARGIDFTGYKRMSLRRRIALISSSSDSAPGMLLSLT